MRGASTDSTRNAVLTTPSGADAARRQYSSGAMPSTGLINRAMPSSFVEPGYGQTTGSYADYATALQTVPSAAQGMASASAMPGLPAVPFVTPYSTAMQDPQVWLVATFTPGGGTHHLEGAGRPGAVRVSRPYGHLRSIRPILPPGAPGSGLNGDGEAEASTPRPRRGRTSRKGLGSAEACPPQSNVPALRALPQIVSAVEVETDTGIFRVERPNEVLGHSDVAWALANLEAGEPDSVVPLPRRQLAMLLTLLPTPADPEHPEQDPIWGWAHRLRGPWERGPLHARGRLGKLIAVDADPSGRGMHRACFEMLGTEDVVWALGVPCYRQGSVYELVPMGRGSRWLSWPLVKTRSRTAAEKPSWEIARVVYRVGSPRWPLAGIVEPLGPMGVAG